MRDIQCQPRLQNGKKNKENNKRRGVRRGDEVSDPAQAPVEIITMVPEGHLGRGATPPESLDSSHASPRTCYASLVSGTMPLPTTMHTTTTRATRRRKGGPGGKLRRSATDGSSFPVPSSGKTTAPLTLEELREGMLTEEAIRAAAGRVTTRELHDVTRLALVVDSSKVTIEGVWDAVPNLHTLTLDGSRLLSFRDLGVGLRNLNTLSLESSFVEDLDGIGALSGLRELRLARNRVLDVTPLACHATLQILGLEKNRVSDMNALEILSSLPLLYSLNICGNPLMESLGKLRDGRGRGVVHKLIPQLKILDSTHLSSREDGPVDAQTLDEADDLICQGASRARAAWAEEEETAAATAAAAAAAAAGAAAAGIDVAGENGRRRQQRSGEQAAQGDSSSSRLRIRSKVAAEAAGGDPGSPQRSRPEQVGVMHWDSDLTQGGRQALSGNPSSAIRRHKWGRETGNGQDRQSPTRVLETLDLAKVVEKGLKQRHKTRQSAERVSEWRRETCSDSVPEENPAFAPLDASVPQSRIGVLPLSSSALEGGFDHQLRLGAGGGRIPAPNAWASSLSTIAAGASIDSAAYDGGRDSVSGGGNGEQRSLSGRPWTTGGLVGGSRRPTPLELEASDTSGNGRTTNADDHNLRRSSSRKDGGRRRVEQEVRPHTFRRRPQTAKESGKRNAAPNPDDGSLSWQPVWESLQTAELISTPRLAAKATTTAAKKRKEGRAVGTSLSPAGDGANRKMGSVDFGRQRRARATMRVARGYEVDYLNESDDAYSTPEEEGAETSGGDDSEEAGDRAQIKKRALELSSGVSDARVPSGVSSADPVAVPISPPSPPAMAATAAVTSTGSHEGTTRNPPPQQVVAPSESDAQLPAKARRRENTSSRSRRSLTVMDDDTCSSSGGGGSEDEGGCLRRAFEPAAPRGDRGDNRSETGQNRSGNDRGGLGGARDDAQSDGNGGGGGGGWSSSPRRESSIRASRMLGFDLRKSLAAIDEWTDKATAMAKGSGCGGTPRQGAAKTDTGYLQGPLLVEHTATTATTSGNSPFSPAARLLNREDGREADGTSWPGEKAGKACRVVGVTGRPLPPTLQKKNNTGAPASIGMHSEDAEDVDDDEGEAVLSVAAARAALGISKEATASSTATSRGRGTRGAPSMADMDAITAERNDLSGPAGGPTTAAVIDYQQKKSRSNRSSRYTQGKKSSGGDVRSDRRMPSSSKHSTGSAAASILPGAAVGMSDEKLQGMLKQQPRMVPELRTKESFREFFQGMEAERMSRLLRGAYEGNLPADQVDKKVKKRLGLVGDMLAW